MRYKVLASAGSIQYSQNAIDHLKAGYMEGLVTVTKDEYASSLRAYQSAREDITSPDRLRWAVPCLPLIAASGWQKKCFTINERSIYRWMHTPNK